MAAKDDYEAIKSFVDWLGDAFDDEEKQSFMNITMQKRGHKAVPSWIDASDDDKKDKPDNVFGFKTDKKKASGSGWQY